MKFSGKVWSDYGTLVNSDKPRDAAMLNTGTGFVVLSHHSLLLFISYIITITTTAIIIIDCDCRFNCM